MKMDVRVQDILGEAQAGISPNRQSCEYLLSFSEITLEASMIRAMADSIIRAKSANSAILLGQVGIDIGDCPGGCKFCVFGEGHASLKPQRLSDEQIAERVDAFARAGDLYGLFLMAMHDYDLPRFLKAVEIARQNAPRPTQLWSNVGDTGLAAFREMKAAGIDGVYHVCRIGEGTDTKLRPEDRVKTMENAVAAGLSLYTCCEPIGPEHSAHELVENMFIGIELGCEQHAAMRRVAVPGAPLSVHGQISDLRLAQMVAVVALASFTAPNMTYVGVHEPNMLGYASGANIITAESGANPRDNRTDTEAGRGMDMDACRRMLLECGFAQLSRGDESRIPLTLDYVRRAAAL